MPPPPESIDELLARARALAGLRVSQFATIRGAPLRTKGKVGEALERALGASPERGATLDFPELGVELKTVPVTPEGRPRESTFVCAVQLSDADRAEWESSWVRAKLARVLWIPIVHDASGDKIVGQALLWSPSADQEAVLCADFEELLGTIAIGGIEGVTAHMGRWLQLRPKAADGRARTLALGPDQQLVATTPRGFYLRTRFTGALLADPLALPE